MARKTTRQRRNIPVAESFNQKRTRGRQVGYERPLIDWRKEFGLGDFALAARNVLTLCEEIYRARMRQLKFSEEMCAPLLMARTNDAIVAARAALDECPARIEVCADPHSAAQIGVIVLPMRSPL